MQGTLARRGIGVIVLQPAKGAHFPTAHGMDTRQIRACST
jgi:hypothetical protein